MLVRKCSLLMFGWVLFILTSATHFNYDNDITLALFSDTYVYEYNFSKYNVFIRNTISRLKYSDLLTEAVKSTKYKGMGNKNN